MSKKKLEIDLQSTKNALTSLKEKYDAQTNQNQADAHALATLQHQQTLLHEENSRLVSEIAQLKATERSGGSEIDSAAQAQIQKLKSEKKQLKAYAINLKGQLETAESMKSKQSMSDADHKIVQGLVKKLTPLLATLEAEVQSLQNIKSQCSSDILLTNSKSPPGQELGDNTAKAIESGMNTMDTVSMMLDYTNMKLETINASTEVDNSTDKALMKGTSQKKSTQERVVPEHSGNVHAPVLPSPSNSQLSSIPEKVNDNKHPPTCNCMKCKAQSRRPSKVGAVISALKDVEESVEKRLTNKM